MILRSRVCRATLTSASARCRSHISKGVSSSAIFTHSAISAPALSPQGAGSIATLILIFVQHPADRLQQFVNG